MQKQLYFSNQQPNEFQSTDSPAFIGNQVKLPTDDKFSVLHYHDRYEIGICDSGEGVFLAKEKIYYLSQGDVIFIAPGVPHFSHTLSSDVPCICRFVYINADNIVNILKFLLKNNSDVIEDMLMNARTYVPAIIHSTKQNILSNLLVKTIELCKENQPYLTELSNLSITQFIIEAYNEFFAGKQTAKSNNASSNDKLIEDVAEYLALHYNCNDTVKSLAESYHLSESQFSKRFIKVYGISPAAYRIKLRCNVAAELIEHTELSIQFISQKVGYTDTSEFYKAFKKNFGMSPTSYRKARCVE